LTNVIKYVILYVDMKKKENIKEKKMKFTTKDILITIKVVKAMEEKGFRFNDWDNNNVEIENINGVRDWEPNEIMAHLLCKELNK